VVSTMYLLKYNRHGEIYVRGDRRHIGIRAALLLRGVAPLVAQPLSKQKTEGLSLRK